MTVNSRRTVVGYNGSPSARAALEWAAVDARERNSELLILHADEWVRTEQPSGAAPDRRSQSEAWPQTVVGEGYARVRQLAPDLIVTAESGLAGVSRSLVEVSRTADLVVLGAPEDPGPQGSVLGHTSAAVVARAHCPVVIVGAGHAADVHSSLPIVVGFDGSPGAERALYFAAERADRTRVPLHVIVAYSVVGTGGRLERATDSPGVEKDGVPVFGTDAGYAAAELAAEAIARVHRSFPGLETDFATIDGPVIDALVERSGRCSLIVVGNRERGLTGALLGQSVGNDLITRTHGNLAVVH